MPSELVWVALISSGSALLASILTARFTSGSTQRHIDAQAKDRNRQIEHQVDEARKNRIAESRKVYLDPLKLALIQWLSATGGLNASYSSLQVGYEREVGAELYTGLSAQLKTAANTLGAAAEELTRHLGQISDPELSGLLSQATQLNLTYLPDYLTMARTSATVGEHLSKGETISPELLATSKSELNRMKEILEERQELLIRINRRIEVLLAVAEDG